MLLRNFRFSRILTWQTRRLVLLFAVLFSASFSIAVQEPLSEAAQEVLKKRCLACHGATQMSELDLRSREAALVGGTRGPSLVPGRPQQSALFLASAHQGELKMPPGSEAPLAPQELEVLRKWIEQGADWPGEAGGDKEPSWWSFRKLTRPEVPQLASGKQPKHPIDAFVMARLEKEKLAAAPLADKVTLVRRAYFDLIGLPPTPEQVERFLKDDSPRAWRNLIDELLDSPRYGERWGRHWLDVVRYADSAGFEGDLYYPNAWRYRDYVIKSFNEDKPYDRFVQEQIAGDELWPNNLELEGFYDMAPEKLEHLEARVGTSLYTFGPEIQESHLDGELLRYERLTDWVNTTGAAFLGLTVECSRCHDHKFDPLTQKDYFSLQAVFASSQPVTVPVVASTSMGHRDEFYHQTLALDEVRASYLTFEKQVKDRVMESKKTNYPPEVARAYEVPEKERTEEEAELATPLTELYMEMEIEEFLEGDEAKRYEELQRQVMKAAVAIPVKDASHKVRYDGFFDVPTATVLGHIDPEIIPDVYVLGRGELSLKKERVRPSLPAALRDPMAPAALLAGSSGPRYRKQLALWLTRPTHPLTARVMVNRIWQGHFGRGIVSTTNDFGRQGSLPSHPALIDWLASEFVDSGWSVKSMHRLIMTSRAYRRSSRFTSEKHRQADPDNGLLWRANRRRLEGEAIWDSIHFVAGTLNLRMGGRPSIPPLSTVELAPLRHKAWWVAPADAAEGRRRGVYIMTRRNFTFPMFDKFDVPNSSFSCARREVTTVAPQALWALNNEATYRRAQELATRLVREEGDRPEAWVEVAWLRALARSPSPKEKREALALVQHLSQEEAAASEKSWPEPLAQLGAERAAALTQLCLTVFNLNEFLYVD